MISKVFMFVKVWTNKCIQINKVMTISRKKKRDQKKNRSFGYIWKTLETRTVPSKWILETLDFADLDDTYKVD